MAHVLVLSLVFPPDNVSTAVILGELSADLKAAGHQVSVVTTTPHYNRDLDAEARQLGADALWLGVWERNPRAIAFYGKVGFVDVGSHLFVVGADAQTDRIMVRSLPPEPAPEP